MAAVDASFLWLKCWNLIWLTPFSPSVLLQSDFILVLYGPFWKCLKHQLSQRLSSSPALPFIEPDTFFFKFHRCVLLGLNFYFTLINFMLVRLPTATPQHTFQILQDVAAPDFTSIRSLLLVTLSFLLMLSILFTTLSSTSVRYFHFFWNGFQFSPLRWGHNKYIKTIALKSITVNGGYLWCQYSIFFIGVILSSKISSWNVWHCFYEKLNVSGPFRDMGLKFSYLPTILPTVVHQ